MNYELNQSNKEVKTYDPESSGTRYSQLPLVALDYAASSLQPPIPIGIHKFDKVMDKGVRGGELIIVSGQTSEGKTSVCQFLTKNMIQAGNKVIWFSYEMSPYYLQEKFKQMGLKDEDGKTNALLYKILSPRDLNQSSVQFIEEVIVEILSKTAITPKAVFIDHLHYLVNLQDSKNSSLMIGGIVRELKKMAVKYDIPIFLIAHTKKIYQGEEVDLSSIRDSSLIAQEADYVFMVSRIKKKKEFKGKLQVEETSGTEWTSKTKVSLLKNRRTGERIYINFEFNGGNLLEVVQHYSTEIYEKH